MTNNSDNQDTPFGPDLGFDISVVPENLVTEKDAEEFFKWIIGVSKTPPQSIQRIITNIAQKINVAMGYLITLNLSRADHVSKFMKKAEEELFDVNKIYTNDMDENKELYELANKALKDNLEWTRKFISQNKEGLEDAGESVDTLKALLLSLPKDKLEWLLEQLKTGKLFDKKEEK